MPHTHLHILYLTRNTWILVLYRNNQVSLWRMAVCGIIDPLLYCTHLLVVFTGLSSSVEVFELFFRCHHNKFLLRISCLWCVQHIWVTGRRCIHAPAGASHAFRGSTSLVRYKYNTLFKRWTNICGTPMCMEWKRGHEAHKVTLN